MANRTECAKYHENPEDTLTLYTELPSSVHRTSREVPLPTLHLNLVLCVGPIGRGLFSVFHFHLLGSHESLSTGQFRSSIRSTEFLLGQLSYWLICTSEKTPLPCPLGHCESATGSLSLCAYSTPASLTIRFIIWLLRLVRMPEFW